MKLTAIAAAMKTHARAFPGAVVTPQTPLAHGARLRLKYDADACTFKLQIARSGNAPDKNLNPRAFNAWHREIKTFARDFDATPDALVEYQNGARTYAAVVTWSDDVTAADIDEMEQTHELD